MYLFRIKPYVFPRVNLLNSICVDDMVHFHRTPDEYIAFFIKSGDMYLMEDSIPYHLAQGDWILLEPGKEHYGYKSSKQCDYFYIHFTMENMTSAEIDTLELQQILNRNKMDCLQGKMSSEDIFIPKLFHAHTHDSYNSILHILSKAGQHFNTYKEFYDYQTSCSLIELFIHLSHLFSNWVLTNEDNSVKKSTIIVYQLLKDMNRNYAEKFSSHSIELKYCCNFDYINRIFKKETGKTIFTYLTMIRISQAKILLTSGNLPVKTIALRVGYEDIYYFSNSFKKETGLSPTQYRKLILGS